MAESVNSRAAPRVTVDAFVKVGDGGKEYVFRTRDLSKSGLFLYTKISHAYPLKVGSTVELELYDHDQSVACRCVVVRVVESGSEEAQSYPTGFGLRIVDIDDANRGRLDTMIDRVKRDGGPY